MPQMRMVTFAGSSSYASVRLRRAELALMAMMVAISVLTVGVGATMVFGAMGYGPHAPIDIALEGDTSPEAGDD